MSYKEKEGNPRKRQRSVRASKKERGTMASQLSRDGCAIFRKFMACARRESGDDRHVSLKGVSRLVDVNNLKTVIGHISHLSIFQTENLSDGTFSI